MTRVWEFTDDEFDVLWEQYTGGDLPPKPMTYTSRFEFQSDYARNAWEIRQRLRDTLDGSIAEVLEVIARPEVLVQAMGWYDRNEEDPQKWIRARAVRSGASGYILTQRPGETAWHSGGFTITECGPHGLADAIVATLPNVGAGKQKSFPLDVGPKEEAEPVARGLVTERVNRPTIGPTERFFDTPADRTGVINVRQGHSKFGRRGILKQTLVWRDLPDDGRYVIELDDAPMAIGMGAGQLMTKVDTMIAGILSRLETHWEVMG
ncbi:ESX secretion-associated protein EspG [Nocardia sp. NPDC052566]|uniref:ESX secretion-associated protein EspG n=1 Tax=Nocardia sp. NPDC052566 TaxID=3364330 RepID=UPI0037C6B03A